MWPFKRVMYTVEAEVVVKKMEGLVKTIATEAAIKYTEDWYSNEIDVALEESTYNDKVFLYNKKGLISRLLNNFFESKYAVKTNALIRLEAQRYVSSEEFLDKIIARIKNKQLGVT